MNDSKTMTLRRIQEMALARIAARGKVTETELAHKAGVSRTLVREALARMMADGILIRRQNVGIILKPPTSRDIIELYEARAAIECAAARLTAERADSACKQRLLALAKTMERPAAAHGENAYVDDRKDVHFHKSIVNACGNRHLQRLFEHFHMLWLAMCFGHLFPVFSRQYSHVHIARALLSGQADRAENIVHFHILETAKKLAAQMRK